MGKEGGDREGEEKKEGRGRGKAETGEGRVGGVEKDRKKEQSVVRKVTLPS